MVFLTHEETPLLYVSEKKEIRCKRECGERKSEVNLDFLGVLSSPKF